MSDPFLWGAEDPAPLPRSRPAATPQPVVATTDPPRAGKPLPVCNENLRCDHCGQRIRNHCRTVVSSDVLRFDFHGDRRACRVAARETLARDRTCVVMPPDSAGDLDSETYGAALAGFDYVHLPWWMRWVPDRWLDDLRREVAVKVGGIVERRCFLKASGAEDDDA
jgi:hypothetical protein